MGCSTIRSGSNRKGARAEFFGRDVFEALQFDANVSIVVGGDFNALLSPMDVENGFGYSQKKCTALANLVKVAKVSDVFRHFFPNKIEFTFLGKTVHHLV